MTTATKPRTPKPPTLPDPCDLLAVRYDHDRSTRLHSVYAVRSGTVEDRIYKVVHDTTRDAWTCECTGYLTHGHCRHRALVARYARRRWWLALYADYGAEELAQQYDAKCSLVEAGYADAEDLSAIEALVSIQTAREMRRAA